MISRRAVAITYALHSWCGIMVGLWLFVVAVTGALLVFKNEIDRWGNPSVAAGGRAGAPAARATVAGATPAGATPAGATPAGATPAIGPDAVLSSLAREHPELTPTLLQPPSAAQPSWSVFTSGESGRGREKFMLRADTGEVLGHADSELGQFLRNIHVFVVYGPRWLVGFLSVIVLFLTLSGVVIHRKILRELFTLRWGRSLRVVTADVHRATGVWGLGFHVLIAFTGAWLGLEPVVETAVNYLAGERTPAAGVALASAAGAALAPAAGAALAPATGARRATPGTTAPSLDRLLAVAAHDVPGLRPSAISLQKWGKPEASVRINGRVEGSISSDVELVYALASGERLSAEAPGISGFWFRFGRLMEPLHFGDFGGLTLRWLYFALGLAQAALSVSATLVWLERRKLRARDTPRAAPGVASLLERGLIGLHAGLVASLASFMAVSVVVGRRLELLPLNHGAGPWVWIASWLLSAVVLALPRRSLACWRSGLALCTLALAAPAVAGLWRGAPLGPEMAATCAALALGTAALALSIGERRVLAARVEPRRALPPPRPLEASSRPALDGPRATRVLEPALRHAAAWLPWVLCALAFATSFVRARSGGDGATIGTGHAGMLVSFLVLLPGLSIASWFPRAGAVAWLLGAATFAALYVRLPRLDLGLITLALGCGALVLAARRAQARTDEAPV